MRTFRWILMGLVAGTILALPTVASADGGAYIDLNKTHFLPGESAVGTTYVYVPENKADVLQRGPFYLYVVPNGASVQEGKPIPDGVIRVGTVTFQKDQAESYELRTTFTVPDLPGDYYSLQVCNDPCTVSGFREPLSGQISIVQTAREGDLLTEQQRLQGKVWSLGRKEKKAEKTIEELTGELQTSEDSRASLSAQLDALGSAQAEAPASSTRPAARPLIDGWAGAMIAGALAALALVFATRRRQRPEPVVVPDTIQELEDARRA